MPRAISIAPKTKIIMPKGRGASKATTRDPNKANAPNTIRIIANACNMGYLLFIKPFYFVQIQELSNKMDKNKLHFFLPKLLSLLFYNRLHPILFHNADILGQCCF